MILLFAPGSEHSTQGWIFWKNNAHNTIKALFPL